MSISSRISLLVDEIGADMRALFAQTANLPSSPACAQIINTDVATDLNKPDWEPVPLNGTAPIMDDGFTAFGDGIRCDFTGRVRASVHVYSQGDTSRISVVMRLARNAVDLGLRNANYLRNSTTDINFQATTISGFLIDVTAGDVITAETQRSTAFGTAVMVVGSSYLTLERIG